jgi:NAD(P) transhydrogenase
VASRSDVSNRHDVVVIGAGPAGEAAAELGGSLGYKVALVERDVVGGTVVTSGGAPTKTFREAAVYLSSFEKEKVYGVALSAAPHSDLHLRLQTGSQRCSSPAAPRCTASNAAAVPGPPDLNESQTMP